MKTTLIFFIFLFLLSCMGQVVSDIYLPALPTIRHVFHVSTHAIQFSIALFMYGFAVSHLIYGPISDSIGRKKPLILGIIITLIGTVLCQQAHTLTLFLIGRFLQGAGAGAAASLFRSILRDLYSGNRLAKIGAFMGISRVFLLASSPLIGGYVLHFFGWRYCFTFLLFYASICLIASIFLLKETNQYQHLHKSDIRSILRNMKTLIRHPIFMGNTLCIMLTFGGILAWLTSLPILLQEVVGLTPVQFGWTATIAGLFFAVGGFANAMLVERLGMQTMLKIGLSIMLLSGLVMLWFGVHHKIGVVVIMLPIVTYVIGSSMIFSNAYAGAFHPFPKMAGTAGAVFGFLQILGGAISSMLMSLTHAYNQIPLSIILMASSLIALLIILLTTRNYQLTTEELRNEVIL